VYLVGLPAEVVTKRIPWEMTKSTMTVGSATKAWAMFTPKGLSVRSFILAISPLITPSSPEEVSMIPMAPALETAEASADRAIHPMGAWTIGISTPRRAVTRLASIPGSWHAERLWTEADRPSGRGRTMVGRSDW
jgi:hypothetical protein